MKCPERNIVSWNGLVSGYYKIRDMNKEARSAFEIMQERRNVVSWTAKGSDVRKRLTLHGLNVTAYTLSGRIEEAAEFFKAMQVKPQVEDSALWEQLKLQKLQLDMSSALANMMGSFKDVCRIYTPVNVVSLQENSGILREKNVGMSEWKGFAREIVAREGGERRKEREIAGRRERSPEGERDRRKEREIAGEEEERNGEEDAFRVYKTLGPTDIFRRNSLSIFNFNFREIFGGLFARLNENIPRKFRRPLKYPSEFPRNIFINSRKKNILCMFRGNSEELVFGIQAPKREVVKINPKSFFPSEHQQKKILVFDVIFDCWKMLKNMNVIKHLTFYVVTSSKSSQMCILEYQQRHRLELAKTFRQELIGKCSSLGMQCGKQPVIPIISYQPEKIEDAL
ncbi:hypothetical protein YC2023_053363 [Brassica napus]